MGDVRCTYCNSDMRYGGEHQVIGAWLKLMPDPDDKNPNPKLPYMTRVICWECERKMLDWLAKASGVDIKCYEADIVFERKITGDSNRKGEGMSEELTSKEHRLSDSVIKFIYFVCFLDGVFITSLAVYLVEFRGWSGHTFWAWLIMGLCSSPLMTIKSLRKAND